MTSSKTWSPFEDEALLTLYRDRKLRKWNEICQILDLEFDIKGKTPKQCRQRYKNHLNPHISKEDWTIEQQKQLVDLQNRLGNRWAEISRKLPGRTDNAVKNKFFSKYRKAIRNINKLRQKSRNFKFKEVQITFLYKLINLIDQKYKPQFSISENLLQEAENLKHAIIQYQNISTEDYQMQLSQHQSLMKKVQYVNSQLKKKAGRRKRATVSNSTSKDKAIIKNTQKKIADFPISKPSTPEVNQQQQDKLFSIKKIESPFNYKCSSVQKSRQNKEEKIELKMEKQLEKQRIILACRWHQQQLSDIWKLPVQGFNNSSEYFD